MAGLLRALPALALPVAILVRRGLLPLLGCQPPRKMPELMALPMLPLEGRLGGLQVLRRSMLITPS